jgi:hypothetical protein
MRLSDLQPAPYNPRKISDEAFAGLGYSLAEFGDLSGITWNRRTGHLVTGHQRVKALTEAHGDLELSGDWIEAGSERYRVRAVDWDESKEKAANLAANNPHIAGRFDGGEQLMIEELKLELPEQVERLRLDELAVDLDASGPEVEQPAEGRRFTFHLDEQRAQDVDRAFAAARSRHRGASDDMVFAELVRLAEKYL